MTPLRSTLRSPFFKLAIRDMAGAGVGIGAWGLVTGVAMVKSGMSVPMALLMSLLVYAGSAQLAVIPLLAVGGPLWVVWLTAACVNLRFVIFSSLWRSSMSPVSRPSSICISVMPVLASPASMARWMGAAPRQRGSRLAWMFRQPSGGRSSTHCGRIRP